MARPTTTPTPSLGDALSVPLGDASAIHRERFHDLFPGPGDCRTFFSPGRVNLFGGHLDYNGGPVLPTAIDRGTFFAVRPRGDGRVRLASTFTDDAFDGHAGRLPASRTGNWFDYPLGVVRALADSDPARADRLAGGFDVLFGGNLPVGAGLSSSASICVGTAFSLDAAFDLGLRPEERVAAALGAERGFVGVQCGIMDPYAVGFARPRHVLWLDCKDESYEHLPLDFDRVAIGVVDSGVQRALARGEFNRRVDECAEAFRALRPHAPGAEVLRDVPRAVLDERAADLDPVVARRARHVIEEVERTFAAREALLGGDLERLGRSMVDTHASLRDLFECSSPELDDLVAAAVDAGGALGARLTGAGFGGCVVMLVRAGEEERVTEAVSRRFEEQYGRRPPVAFFQGDSGPRELQASGGAPPGAPSRFPSGDA
ncbi:MAG: galactokinase [Planctomycetota bacterium]